MKSLKNYVVVLSIVCMFLIYKLISLKNENEQLLNNQKQCKVEDNRIEACQEQLNKCWQETDSLEKENELLNDQLETKWESR